MSHRLIKASPSLYMTNWHDQLQAWSASRPIFKYSGPILSLKQVKLECGPMPNVMAALPTTGGALCSTPQFGWRPLLSCRAVTLPRRETRWNLQGCPKLANRSQPLVGRSSPYYEDMWRRYRCLTSFFFRLLIHALTAKIQPDKVVRRCQNGYFWRPVFAASRMPHISDLHSKFAQRPRHV